jgi:predicted ATPase
MIAKINIAGYKSIKEMDLELRPINVLLGANGAGKSNFISVFSLVKNVQAQNLQRYVAAKGGANSFLYFGKKETGELSVDLTFYEEGTPDYRYHLELMEARDSLIIKDQLAYTKFNGQWASQHMGGTTAIEADFTESNMGESERIVVQELKALEVYHFHDTGDQSAMKGQCQIHDNRKLHANGSNIAAYLYYLKLREPKCFRRIERAIQSIAPFFDQFVLEPMRLNTDMIELEWREKGFPDTYFNAYHLSDGTLRVICLVTLLMQPEPPKTIIIDEPELGLHPVAINKLAALIRKASEKSQIIVSTQSVNLVDNFDPEDIIVTDRKDNSSVFRRLTTDELSQWLEEYTLGDLWGKNMFGGQPYSV